MSEFSRRNEILVVGVTLALGLSGLKACEVAIERNLEQIEQDFEDMETPPVKEGWHDPSPRLTD